MKIRKFLPYILLLFILIVPVLFYQNCGKNFQTGMVKVESDGNSTAGTPTVTPTTSPTSPATSSESENRSLFNLLTPIYDENCLNNSSRQACIFWKNPVAQKGSNFGPGISPVPYIWRKYNGSDKEQLVPKMVVSIADSTLTENRLKNSSYIINSYPNVNHPSEDDKGLLLPKDANGNFKFPYLNSSSQPASTNLIALMAHYWLNFQKDFMSSWVGNFFSSNGQIKVYVRFDSYLDDHNKVQYFQNAAWLSEENTIYMGVQWQGKEGSSADQEFALSAEIFCHEAGHANYNYASKKKSMDTLNGPQKSCGSSECCTPANGAIKGCGGAIDEGVADYHSVILFDNGLSSNGTVRAGVGLGEALENNIEGFSEYGLIRNPASNKDLTLDQAYYAPKNYCDELCDPYCDNNYQSAGFSSAKACKDSLHAEYNAMIGEVHVMGRIYASIWYQIRAQAKSSFGFTGMRDIDAIFSEHLVLLTGADHFEDACKKAVQTAALYKAGQYTDMIKNECLRRGLSL